MHTMEVTGPVRVALNRTWVGQLEQNTMDVAYPVRATQNGHGWIS